MTLSAREYDVARCMANDMTDKATATHLGISERTVQEYLDRIARKLRIPKGDRRARRRIIARRFERLVA